MNAGFAAMIPLCDWCHQPCDDPERTRTCECPEHEGEEHTFCSRSCKLAFHG